MKKVAIATLALASLLAAAAVLAQTKTDEKKDINKGTGMGKNAAASAQTAHTAQGVVKKLNAGTGVVTVAHGPVNSLNWPPMTMGFKVKDKALLARLKEGQTVTFEFVQQSDGYVVTKVK